MFFKKRKKINLFRFNNKIFFNNYLSFFLKDDFLFIKKDLIIYKVLLVNNVNVFIKKNYLYFSLKKFFINKFFFIGTYLSILKNFIDGLNNFYLKKLILVGVGYKAFLSYNFLYLYIGFSHPICFEIPKDVYINIISLSEIHISGFDKQRVFQVASIIKKFKKPDVYKGKGIRYLNEVLKFKPFKKK